MNSRVSRVTSLTLVGSFMFAAASLRADDDKGEDPSRNGCRDLPSHGACATRSTSRAEPPGQRRVLSGDVGHDCRPRRDRVCRRVHRH